MSRRNPLVYIAKGAMEDAARLLPGCPENTIAQAISAGAVRVGGGRAEIDGAGWGATAIRMPGRVRRKPRAWIVVSIEDRSGERRAPTRKERGGSGTAHRPASLREEVAK
jgi:hypothetical protein